jgi:formylglycine-generating enzyme required for sulfatase activity
MLAVFGLGLSACGNESKSAAPAESIDMPAFTGRNVDWTPVIQEFDGVAMVLVPPGCFTMGRSDDYFVPDSQHPAHRVCFDEPFWIDRYEITNAQFAAFDEEASADSRWIEADRPFDTLSWPDAQAFCESRGGYLPSEAEWEYAARGPDSYYYPWGNVWDSTRAVSYRDADAGTAPVGSLPGGASWVGALDMSGNVAEWVADYYDEAYYSTLANDVVNPTGPDSGEGYVIRGGSWDDTDPKWFRATDRSWNQPEIGTRGFTGSRCVRSVSSLPEIPPTPSPTIDSFSAVREFNGSNTDWAPVIQEFDGVEMALIPAGCFVMGNDDEYEESPAHRVCFTESFWIDRYEASSADDQRPDTMTWFDAQTLCESRGTRLPTEAEWEYAARGPDSWVYPWGNEWDGSLLPDPDGGSTPVGRGNTSAPIGSSPGGASWIGALDLSGNVAEWVADWYSSPYPSTLEDGVVNPLGPEFTDWVDKVQRGGAYNDGESIRAANESRAAYRYHDSMSSDSAGVRCVRSG